MKVVDPISCVPEKLDQDDRCVKEVDRVLHENKFVQVRLVGPVGLQ